MSYQTAARDALRYSLAFIYQDGAHTQGGTVALDARGGVSKAGATTVAIKLQRERRSETLQAANVEPHQAMFYVLTNVSEGDIITFQGESWKVTSKSEDPLGAASTCVCDKIGATS